MTVGLNRVEIFVAKEKLLIFEQFLLLSQFIQTLSAVAVSESVYMWEMVNVFICFYFSVNTLITTTDLKVVVYSGQLDLIVDTIG